MADPALGLSITKLGIATGTELLNLATCLISKKASLLEELPSRMGRVKDELEVMQGFLKQLDTRGTNEGIQEEWIQQVRKEAYHIEDILDEYLYIVGGQEVRGFCGYVKKMVKKPKTLFTMSDIGAKLKVAEDNLQQLKERRERWVQTPIGASSIEHDNLDRARFSHFVDGGDLVGFEKERKKLTELLLSLEKDLSILSAWGMGGLGKTALVSHVFEKQKGHFDCHAWISFSQSIKNDDEILRKMITELYKNDHGAPPDIPSMDTRGLKETIQTFLQKKRYLIVLDDVWNPADFGSIRELFLVKDSHEGSKIVIITQNEEVASFASEDKRMKLEHLGENEAWTLFCRWAFRNEKGHDCPAEVTEWARKIVTKCEGLPLAIVSIGDLLSLKPKTELEWKRVFNQINWLLVNDPALRHLKNTLNQSYSNLPDHLKNCFLYCSMFPEDTLISADRLVKLWIAEGFIQEKGKSTLEEVGEGHLLELTRRSMLQPMKHGHRGTVELCRMHNLVREFILSLSRKKNFHEVYRTYRRRRGSGSGSGSDSGVSNQQERETSKINATSRRLSVIECSSDLSNLSSEHLPFLRTLIAFDTSTPSSRQLPSISSKFKYLAVLDLSGLPIDTLPDAVGSLFNLRYLSLKCSKVKALPKSIRKLTNLQTLDLYSTEIKELPRWIVKLKKLRHLYAGEVTDQTFRAFNSITGPKAPEGLRKLKELQTLVAVEPCGGLVGRLGSLTQIRDLGCYGLRGERCEQLCASVSCMLLLWRLVLSARDDEKEVLRLDSWEAPPNPPTEKKLVSLNLRGRLSQGSLDSSFLRAQEGNLKELALTSCHLEVDPIPSLARFSSLTRLSLRKAYDGEQLVFTAGSFPNLQDLSISDMPRVKQVEIQERSMAKLKTLELQDMTELRDVPRGIEHLKSLPDLQVHGSSPELKQRAEEMNKRRMALQIITIHVD
ncbi:disease resistance protein RPM1-like [Typha latifolia]|uniref:disease resistance protein RPM1-like n=1 Tax=Typha latifolia TaxID=4733 RepID=UPI003C2CF110